MHERVQKCKSAPEGHVGSCPKRQREPIKLREKYHPKNRVIEGFNLPERTRFWVSTDTGGASGNADLRSSADLGRTYSQIPLVYLPMPFYYQNLVKNMIVDAFHDLMDDLCL